MADGCDAGRNSTGFPKATHTRASQSAMMEALGRGGDMRISVIGCGYLGAAHAAAMAELGHDVSGIDVDERKVDALTRGEAPFVEPGLPELLTSGVASGRLRFSPDMADAAGARVHFLAVGTPQLKGSNAA